MIDEQRAFSKQYVMESKMIFLGREIKEILLIKKTRIIDHLPE